MYHIGGIRKGISSEDTSALSGYFAPSSFPYLSWLSFGCVGGNYYTSNFRQNQCTLIVPTREIILCELKFNPKYYKMENAYSCFGITCDVIFSSRVLVGLSSTQSLDTLYRAYQKYSVNIHWDFKTKIYMK